MRASVPFLLSCGPLAEDSGHVRSSQACPGQADHVCTTERRSDLGLQFESWAGDAPRSEADGDSILTWIDATAGGDIDALEMPWAYLRIEETAWVAVEISDLEAESSQEWDLAIRRAHVRMNSGTSGSGCVQGASLEGLAWADMEDFPEGMLVSEEDFYTDDCELITDGSGVPNSPRLVLTGWWENRGCLSMTGQLMLLQPHLGGSLGMTVEAYYGSGQESCDAGEGQAEEGGRYRFRWQWLSPSG